MIFFIMLILVCCVYSLELPHRCTHKNHLNEVILMRTHNIPSCTRKSKKKIPMMPPDLAL